MKNLKAAIADAVHTYLRRRDRSANPRGTFDKARRWYPDEGEMQVCCKSIRSPSRAYPFSLMVHCRTMEHVARLYGVNVSELRRAVRAETRAVRAETKPTQVEQPGFKPVVIPYLWETNK